jgi:DNA-binding NarL/FixJ family response regulator
MPPYTSNSPIGVLLVEDDAVTRRILSLAIESEPTLRLSAALDCAKDAFAWLEKNKPDVLLTDLGLPDGSGIDVILACTRRNPGCDIMVITVSSDEANVLASIEAGASGYILKDTGRLDVVKAIKDLRAGGSPMSPAIARMVLSRLRDGKKPAPVPAANENDPNALTKREATILDLIARGETYGEVARLLNVSVGTVQTHIKSIYGKLCVHSRGEAVFEAHRRGLLQLGGGGETP